MRLRFSGSAAVAAAHPCCDNISRRDGVAEARSTMFRGGRPVLPASGRSGRLELRDFGDEPQLVLDLAAIETRMKLRFRFEILGDQHFYGLGHGGRPFGSASGHAPSSNAT